MSSLRSRWVARRAALDLGSAFTLVELLVVIGIVALLVSVLLPALTRANRAAKRTACLSNQRQLAVGMLLYASENRGVIPPNGPGDNASTTWVIRRQWPNPNPGEAYKYATTREGWTGPGYLVFFNMVKTPRAFYCPDLRRDRFEYTDDWEKKNRNYATMGFLYRHFGEQTGQLTAAQVREVQDLRLGRMKNKALTMDIFMQPTYWDGQVMWPHTSPYAINVGYADGHAETVMLRKGDFDVASKPYTVDQADLYVFLMFKAMDNKDFTAVRAKFK